jgi:pimeloyl-ACP methyl ester carboxylesterase
MSRSFARALFVTWLTACGSDREPEAERRSSEPEARPVVSEPQPELARNPNRETAVELVTSDGVTIRGTFVGGDEGEDHAPGPVAVLVHQLGSTRAEWAPLVEALTRAPRVSVLAIDLRGHGESTRKGDATLDFNTFDDADWAKLEIDVAAAVALARERFEADRVVLVGSSIGSSAVIRVAAGDPSIAAVVAISPGRAYRGLDAMTPIASLSGKPFLAIASIGEADSAESARAMAAATGGEVELYEGDAHGLAIAADSPDMIRRADAFIRGAVERTAGD